MLILLLLFEAFSTTKPENRIFQPYALDGHRYIFSLALQSSAQGKTGPHVPASVIEKLRAAWGPSTHAL